MTPDLERSSSLEHARNTAEFQEKHAECANLLDLSSKKNDGRNSFTNSFRKDDKNKLNTTENSIL